jgi:hypothetical protein
VRRNGTVRVDDGAEDRGYRSKDRAPEIDARRAGSAFVESCHKGGDVDCPIIDALNEAPERKP